MSKYRCNHIVILITIVFLSFPFKNSAIAGGSIFESCASEMKSFCSNVTLGNGRLMACFYAHEDKLSADCDAAVADIADQIDWLFNTMRYYAEQCEDDIQKHCVGVEFGGGAIYHCLVSGDKTLSSSCKKVLPQIKKRIQE